jgi:hypothetical protein
MIHPEIARETADNGWTPDHNLASQAVLCSSA